MGFSPREVDRMDLFQFLAARAGWKAAHAPAGRGAAAARGGRPLADISVERLRELGVKGF